MKQRHLFLIFFVLFTMGLATCSDFLGERAEAQTIIPHDSIIDYTASKEYEIGGITVSGTQFLDQDILIKLSGLSVGQKIFIPGDDIGKAIEALWKQSLFSNVKIYITKFIGDKVFLDYNLSEKPRMSSFTFKGIGKSEQNDLRDKLGLIKNKVLTDNIKVNTINTVTNYYVEKGFLHVKVNLSEVKDTSLKNSEILFIYIDKGNRVKIDEIVFSGNDHVKEGKLLRLMKKTKRNTWWSVFTISKFLQKEYKADKNSVVNFYNSKGYRDAYITSDSITTNEKGNYVIHLNISEGNKYYFRNITWSGNSKHRTGLLDTILNIKKGDVYNDGLLQRRLNGDPNGNDVSSLYMDDGYLFFQVNPIELSADNDSIDLEIRVYEGPQAIINRITISGNDKTNEHVIRRVLKTLPGNKFSRADVIRSQREIATLGFFDPNTIQINPTPHPENGTVDIDYKVEEKPSDQLELQAGWGGKGTGVVGSLGVSFNNFAIKKLFKEFPPAGDGQKFSVRIQSNGKYYQSGNISFTEPWLGGKKPTSFTTAIVRSRLANGYSSKDAKFGKFVTNGASIGIGKQLKWPDDFFTGIISLDYQNYNLKNWNSNSFILTDGVSNNLSAKFAVNRNSLDEFIFPKRGSSFEFYLQLTPKYSTWFSNKDFSTLPNEDKYKWIEYHKWRFNADWYTGIVGKLILKTSVKTGYLGYWNQQIGYSPFERFDAGGDGLSQNYNFYGRDVISQRGYDQYQTAATIFNKYSLELRYPFSTNPQAFIYGLMFAEGGNAWTDWKNYDPFKLKRSVGVGLRVFLPIFGTLGFDYGIGFDNPQGFHPANLGEVFSKYGKFSVVLGFEPE